MEKKGFFGRIFRKILTTGACDSSVEDLPRLS